MKYDSMNSTLIDTIVSLAKQAQCDCLDVDNVRNSEEYDFYINAVREGLETIRTLIDMVLKDYPAANKTKEGGEE